MLEADFDYFNFEKHFRGTEEAIKARQAKYVEFFKGHESVLDIGCGRGEFLELLTDSGITAAGVDLNLDMVLLCRDKGLDVTKEDAIEHLANRPDDSLGGIFSAQVVEHLEPQQLVRLLKFCHQKLKCGGVLLIETLNPESLMVHYRWFWMDLSHKRLLHPETLKFLLESIGFHDVQYRCAPLSDKQPQITQLELNDHSSTEAIHFNQAIQHINNLLYSSTDYAVIGQK
jgi:2-polyprenyl-3-methyl-5-hydroxy-6-metoxy-1,4-benzoquinol methylase